MHELWPESIVDDVGVKEILVFLDFVVNMTFTKTLTTSKSFISSAPQLLVLCSALPIA